MDLQMSYNNYLDGDAAYTAVCDFPEPSCVIVKHTNPCGAASRADLKEAYPLAVRADPTSAFGGIVAFNRYASAALNTDSATAQLHFKSLWQWMVPTRRYSTCCRLHGPHH